MPSEICEKIKEKAEEFKANPTPEKFHEVLKLYDEFQENDCKYGYYETGEFLESLKYTHFNIATMNCCIKDIYPRFLLFKDFVDLPFDQALVKMVIKFALHDDPSLPEDIVRAIVYFVGLDEDFREDYEKAREHFQKLRGPLQGYYKYVLWYRDGVRDEDMRPPVMREDIRDVLQKYDELENIMIEVIKQNSEEPIRRAEEILRDAERIWDLLGRPTKEDVYAEYVDEELERLLFIIDDLRADIRYAKKLYYDYRDFIEDVLRDVDEIARLHPDGLYGLLTAIERGEEVENYDEIVKKLKEVCRKVYEESEKISYEYAPIIKDAIKYVVARKYGVSLYYLCQ